MKTKILAIAAMLFAVGTTNIFAANDKNECFRHKSECLQTKTDRQNCIFGTNIFDGITLSNEQKTKLDALKNEVCPFADKQKGSEQQCDKNKAISDRRQMKRDYLEKVKAILSPEQYVTFLENIVVNRPDKMHGKKFDKKGHKGPRGDRDSQSARQKKSK